MTVADRLISQHILESQSRLKRIDELIECAEKATATMSGRHALRSELDQYRKQRNALEQSDFTEETASEYWHHEMLRSAGPMAVWDILAQKLEDLVERVEQ